MSEAEDQVVSIREYRSNELRDYSLIEEYRKLKMQAPKSVYMLPALEDLRVYFGVIFLEAGFYKGGIFKFRLDLPKEYPADNAKPAVTFLHPVFHPLVNPRTHELDLSQKFPVWKQRKHNLTELLKYIRQIFFLFEKDSHHPNPPNRNAALQFARDKQEYQTKVARFIKESKRLLYNPDPGSSLRFQANCKESDLALEKLLRKTKPIESQESSTSGDLKSEITLGKSPVPTSEEVERG
mmetsp:Transcript_3685/g.6460  ORF Transcript_3685/g.6460 Transcript_3685/m.6460 type:complete len:238 (+) Transcript_3685:198-911(+)|eukprot:CAMPEP_0184517546 /NCGR_PEP_ID=MMETSP0198_2-20121128/5613_1 /TAXON_ID=1112570 /ORGANISM="Thraustochytrium sp., Strain LLF1b" /LENGTH=237 /DNA_ID=CAMNT_0026907927 /DNA_START=224 /DNA_END=937 /DNA_ORIENTATION=-